MPSFIWFPVANHKREIKPNIATAKFGDGYEQRTPVGINFMPEVWQLEFAGNREEMQLIDDFLKARGGYESFDWETPDEEVKKFVCRKWDKSRQNGKIVTITCSFEEVFE